MIEHKQPKFYYGYLIVFAGFWIVVVSMAANMTFGVFFEPILTEFGWARAVTAGAMSITSVIGSLFIIISGKLTDRFGPRLVMTAGCILTGLGLILLSRISAPWHLSICFGIIAIGGSCYLVPIVTTIPRWFVKRRGMMSAIILSAIGAAEMIMPPLARWLISNYGWRNSYMILGIAVFIVIFSFAQFMRRDPGQVGQLPYGGSEEKQVNLNLQMGGFSLSDAIRTREFWMFCAVMLCFFFIVSFIDTHFVIHATGLGASRVVAANILVVVGFMYIISMNISGNAADKFGKRLVIVIGFVLVSVALFCWMVTKEVWILYVIGIIYGIGRGCTMAPMPVLMADIFGLKSFGEINGAIFFAANVGSIVGPYAMGYIFDTTGSYFLAFLGCGVFAIIGGILTLLIRPNTGRDKQIAPHI